MIMIFQRLFFVKLLKISSAIFIFGFLFFGNTGSVEAATRTWTGASSSLWSNAGNWGGTAPVTGDDLVFPGSASNLSNTNDLIENTIINSITFSDSGYTLAGNPLILGQGLAGITDSASSGGNTISLDIRVDATRDIVVTNTAETLTINGRIAGVGGINKEGTGKLILSGANSYGGITKINVGILNAQNDRSLGTFLAGTEVVGNAALELQGTINISYEALTLRGYGQSNGGALRNISDSNSFGGLITIAGIAEIQSDSGTLTLAGGVTGSGIPLIIDGAGNVTFSKTPIATGAGTVTKNGAGTLTYNFPNTYTGLTTVNAGTLLYGTNNAILSGVITVTGGTLDIATYSDMVGTVTLGTLDLASGTITGSTGMLSSATWTVYNGTISAIIAGDGGVLNKTTPGTVTLTRPNQYTGTTTVTTGILKIQNSTALGLIDGITTVTAGATLQIDGTGLVVPEYITFAGTGHLYAGAIKNTTGNNSLTGLLTLGSGTASLMEADTGTTLTIDSKGLFAATFGLVIGGAGNITFSATAPIYGTTATLTKNDAGTLTMQAFNNFTGATNISGGEVVLNESGAMPMSTTMTINAGSTLTLDNTSTTTVVNRLADSLILTMNGANLNFTGSSTDNMDETIGSIVAQLGNNIITVTPGSGGSTILQSSSFSFTYGATILFRGNSFGSDPGPDVSTLLFTTAPILTGSGGAANSPTMSIIEGAFGDDSLTGTGTDMVTYGRGNSNGLRLLNGAGFSGEYASTLTANANVKLTASTVAATSSINSLILSGSANITDAGTSQTITLASGNILNLVSSNTIAGANTTLAAGTVGIKISTPASLDISSIITTTAGLTKSGAGTLTFSTAKTYTGLTSVNEGTLLYGINDSISSGNVTVNGGTLDIATFTDTVGAVILQNGTITGSTGVLTGTSYSLREGTVSAIIAGAGAIVTRVATNTAADSVVTLTRDNTYTGATTITSGILKIGGAGNGTNSPLGTIAGATTVATIAALDLNGYTLSTAEPLSLAGLGYGAGTTVANGNSNMGALMNSGVAASYSGDITLTAAARINADVGALTISSNISGNNALTFGGFSDIEYSGVRSGTSTIVKDGIGTLTLSNGSSSYSGVTTISAGTVKLGAASVGGTNSPLGTTAGATSIALGSRLDLNGFSLGIAEPITNLNGVGYGLGDFATGALMNSSGSAVTFTGLITLGAASTIKADYGDINLTHAGSISGAGFGLTLGGAGIGALASAISTSGGTVTKIDTGTWTLSGSNAYTGATTIYAGTLKLGATGGVTNTPLGTTGTGTTVLSGAVLDLNGFTLGTAEGLTINGRGIDDGGAMVNNSAGVVTYSGTRALGSDTRTTNSGAGLLTLSGTQSGAFESRYGGSGNTTISVAIANSASSLLKDGSGTVNLTAANSLSGTTTVYAGTLVAGIANALSAGPLIVKGGTYSMGTFSDTVGAVTLVGGSITSSTGILTGTACTVESGTISAILAGTVSVNKNTNNTVTLTGVSTITSSPVTINAGTLVFSGSGSANGLANTFIVNLGGTLTLDNSSTAVANRIGDAIAVTMNGGDFNFIGNGAGASSETIGQLAIAAGHNVVTITPGAGGSTTLTFANNPGLNRTAGATVLFRGTSFGSAPAANVSTLMFTTTPTLTGAAGAANSTTASVIKGAFGDSSLSGTGSDMVTYNLGNTNGLRLLNGAGFAGEYSATLTTNTNVKLTANTAASAVSINSLILNGFDITNASATVTFSSGAGNILINSANNIAGANTTLGLSTTELDILATANSTISAIIGTATTGSLVLSGSGNVTLSAANAYTSTTFINGATLTAGANNVISSGGVTMRDGLYNLNGNSDTIGALSLTAGTVTTGAGTLTGNGSFTTATNANFASVITGNLGLGANATFTIGDGLMDNDAVISAVISGAFTFGKAGAGVLELSGSNTYTGATTISAGILRLGASGGGTNTPLGTTAGITTVATGAGLDLNGFTLGTAEGLTLNSVLATGGLQNTSSTAVSYSGLITLTASSFIISNYGDINVTNTGNITGTGFTLTIGGAGNGSLASNLNTSTAGILTKNGVGTWTISGGASTFTGLTTVSAGTLKLGHAGSGSNTPLGTVAGGVTVTSGAIFDLNGYTLATAEPIGSLNGTGIASIGAFINSSNNSVTYSGAVTLAAASRIVNYGTGLFIMSGNMSGNFARTLVTVGDITQSSGSIWSGTSTIIKEGSGTLILAGQNTISGAITVSTGTLQLGAAGGVTNTPLGTIAGGVTVSSGAVLDLSTFSAGGATTWEPLTISGSGLLNGGALISNSAAGSTFATLAQTNARIVNNGAGTLTFTGNITGASTFWVGGTGNTTVSAALNTGGLLLTKYGAGTMTITTATSINSSLVRINEGTLAYGATDALSSPPVTVAGGTLNLNGFSDTNLGVLTLIDGSIVNTGGAASITSTGTFIVENGTVSAALAGAGIGLTKNAGGTVTLSGANSFTGTTTINAGTLAWGANDTLANVALTVTGGTADLGTRTDTVAGVTLTSGFITGSTGVLTGASYAVTSGTVSGILGGSGIALTKTTVGTVTLSGANTYTGTTTITAGTLRANSSSALGDSNNTLSFGGGTLQAGGTISSPSSRAVTILTSPSAIDTNGYTVTLSGTVSSFSGAVFTKNGVGTLSIGGAMALATNLVVANGTFDQVGSLNMSGGTVTVASSGVWSNTGTGSVTLAGAVSNSGIITLNSNNGAQCVDGANSILVRSSVNNTLRAWSGAGTFNMYNLDVDDMTGAGVTVYNSTLSGDTTWTVGLCNNISIAGTSNGIGTVNFAVNGVLSGQTAVIGGGVWSASNVSVLSGQTVVAWIDSVADNAESTALAKYDGTGDMTGLVLDASVLSIGSADNQSVSLTDLDLYDCANDEDIMYSVISNVLNVEGQSCAGSVNNAYTGETLSTLALNTLAVATTDTVTTEKINNAGTITATGSPTFNLAGTSGTLLTNTGTFTPATSTVNVTGSSGTMTLLSAAQSFDKLTINAPSSTVSAGAAITMASTATSKLYIQNGTLYDSAVQIVGTATGGSTFVMDAGTSLIIGGGQVTLFPTNYTNGQITLNATSTVVYNATANQTVSGVPTYGNLTLTSTSGTPIKTLGANTTVAGNVFIDTANTLALSTLNLGVTGTTSVTGTLNDASATGTNLFSGAVTINSGGIWSTSNNPAFTFRGGLTNDSSAGFTSGTGVYTFDTNVQTISGSQTFTITNITNGITSSTGLTFSGTQPTVTTLTQGTNAVLTFSGTVPAITTLDASANPNTVQYTGNTQTIKNATYHDLTIGASGTKTLGGAIDVNDDLTISAGTLATADYGITIGGNYSNSGVFTAGAGLVTFDAADTGNTLSGTMTGSSKFNDVVFNNATGAWTFGSNTAEVGNNFTVTLGAVTAPSTTLTISGDFINTPSTSSSFVHNSGTVVLDTTGTSSVVGDTSFYNFTVATDDKRVLFQAGDTFTTNGLLTLTGSSHDHKVYIDSADGHNAQWFIKHLGTESISFVDLEDSGCDVASTDISMGTNSNDSSNNDHDCWIFTVASRGGGGGNAGGESDATPDAPTTGGGSSGGGGNAGGESGGNPDAPAGGGGAGGGGGDSGFLFRPNLMLASVFQAFFTILRLN